MWEIYRILLALVACGAGIFVSGQFNQCLRPPGCYLDECCFNIVPKTGEVCSRIAGCVMEFGRDCCRNSRPVITKYGIMYGYAILLDDMYNFRENGKRYLTIWLGIPYAKPPTRENHLRFKKPQHPDSSSHKYDASYYRPACPQPVDHMTGLINKTRSEDCLYMNMFVMNQTVGLAMNLQRYPILVFFHGGHHSYGSAMRYPGHILAQLNIMVVTVQYRLNAFGFLSTEDATARGNYGLWDQLMALRYLRDNAKKFLGEPNKVTLMGHGSGAGDVALHMLSGLSGMAPVPLFHQAVWASGSDLMEGGFIRSPNEAYDYAWQLAYEVGCSQADRRLMVDCLGQRTANELAEAASKVVIHKPGWLGRPWSPVADGEFLTDTPLKLRKLGKFARIPVIGGVCYDDGSYEAQRNFPNIQTGKMTPSEMKAQLRRIAETSYALDIEGVMESVGFEYTHWPDPTNNTWRLQMYRDLYSDWRFGSGLDLSLKFQSDAKPLINRTHMYVFKYHSAGDPRSRYLGTYHGSELEYIFGFPYLNNSNWPEIGLNRPGFYYVDLDRNMTDYMLYMFSNFIIHGNATPDIIRNLTWDTYRPDNRTYLELNLQEEFEKDFELKQDFRVYHYAFWRDFFPTILKYMPRYSTPMPTPLYLTHYKASTFSLAGILVVVLVVIIGLLIVYIRRRQMLIR